MFRDIVTTLVDVAGLALVALGIGAALFPVVGYAAAIATGAVLLAGGRVADWVADSKTAPAWWRRRFRAGGEDR